MPDLGVVRLDKRAVQRSWEHGKGPIKGHVFAAVPDVLRKGRLALEEPLKGSESGGLYRHIVAPITIGGEAYVVDVQVKSEKGSSRMYVHEVRARKRLQQELFGAQQSAEAIANQSDSTGAGETLLQRIYGVKLGALDLAKRGEVEQVQGPDGASYQLAWHGTPHKGIEKEGFKLGAIGSGEGAQAYGWGLYFAGDRRVSDAYRKKSADDGDSDTVYGRPAYELGNELKYAANKAHGAEAKVLYEKLEDHLNKSVFLGRGGFCDYARCCASRLSWG